MFVLFIACSVAPRDVETVQIGGSPNEDACGAEGVVDALGQDVVIRSGPGSMYEQIDSVAPDTPIWLCDERAGWVGIIYGKSLQGCDVASPVLIRQDYKGPCRSGWVSSDLVAITAG